MRICALTCAAVVVAVPAYAQEAGRGIELQFGHPVYHESEREAGVAMGLSITPERNPAADLIGLCEELRLAAGLANERGDELGLEVIFVVPYKGMAIEGYYLPKDGTEGGALVPGNGIAAGTLDSIITRAGIPPSVLEETNVEHEISCETGAPLWHVGWSDVRPIGDEDPDTVIERAYHRFMAIHQAVVEHNAKERNVQTGQTTTIGG
jgi:hypothetical protein